MSTPDAARWRREATAVTDAVVLHPDDRKQALKAAGWWRRTRRQTMQAEWAVSDERAATAAHQETARLRAAITALRDELTALEALERAELRGRGDAEARRLDAALDALTEADVALDARDFGTAGRHADQVVRSLAAFGGPLAVAVTAALESVPLPRAARAELAANHDQRIDVEHELLAVRGTASALRVAAELMAKEAAGLRLAGDALRKRPNATQGRRRASSAPLALPVQSSDQLETFADVAGLDETIDLLETALAAVVDGDASSTGTWRNGVLLHGPPGTGKTLLSRAFAGEHGLRHIRLTPAALGSSVSHQTAQNLLAAFELAAASTPCVLLIDEIDVFAAHRTGEASADQREIVTQLMTCLEDFRTVPGLVIMAATNDLDRLDPGLREGRFDLRVLVPLPDAAARAEVLRVHLEQRDVPVLDELDLAAIARRTAGRNGAAIEALAVRALQRCGDPVDLTHEHLEAAVRDIEASDRLSLDERLSWDDVVLAEPVRRRLSEVLSAFADPEAAAGVGVSVPAGVLLYGPPGTGKTTIAKVLASEARASFLEVSASDLLSKYAGESEQRVTRLFERARAVRPTIIFIDEVDGLLRRRRPDSTTPWDDRVVNEFLRQLDGLKAVGGVLLVAATNRPDVLDDAVVGRRLLPLEVGLPDDAGRRRILQLLTRGSRLGADVDLDSIARATAGMSGADLRALRDAAGLRALGRRRGKGALPRVRATDFDAALDEQRGRSSLAQV